MLTYLRSEFMLAPMHHTDQRRLRPVRSLCQNSSSHTMADGCSPYVLRRWCMARLKCRLDQGHPREIGSCRTWHWSRQSHEPMHQIRSCCHAACLLQQCCAQAGAAQRAKCDAATTAAARLPSSALAPAAARAAHSPKVSRAGCSGSCASTGCLRLRPERL